MPHKDNYNKGEENVNRLGFYTAILTVVITLVTFVIAIFTPPLSGPFCKGACIEYPFTNIASRFPRDYIWMYPAILASLVFVALTACIFHYAPVEKKIFGHIAVLFSLISATILIIDYFIQISVIQPSVINGETDGIAMLSQYNPHGIFIALEDIGYLMMSTAFLCMAPIFSKTEKLERAIRRLFVISFILTISSFIIISVIYGVKREYRFEIAVIMINYIVLIVSGVLLSLVFKKNLVNEHAGKIMDSEDL